MRGGHRRARRCAWSRCFDVTKSCREWEGTCPSMLVINMLSNPNWYCSSASPKAHSYSSQRTRNSSTRVKRRPYLIRMGSGRANVWCMAALSSRASLPLRGSTVVRVFLLRPDLLGGVCKAILAARAGSPWGWARDARWSALWMQSYFEAMFTTRGDMLSGIEPQSVSKMDRQRGAMGSSPPKRLVILLLILC